MALSFLPPYLGELHPRIVVIGVGGRGARVVNDMIPRGFRFLEFIVADTDADTLAQTPMENRVHLDVVTGASGDALGPRSIGEIQRRIDGAHLVIVATGMGGRAGTWAAPVVAKIACEMNIVTIGVVTTPLHFESDLLVRRVYQGIEEMRLAVDTLVVASDQNCPLEAEGILMLGVRCVTDLLTMPGLIAIDFADIRPLIIDGGMARIGVGVAVGDNCAIEAAEAAIANLLMDGALIGDANSVLIINIVGGLDMSLLEVEEAAKRILDAVPKANYIFGGVLDETLAVPAMMRVSVIVGGHRPQQTSPRHSFAPSRSRNIVANL